MTRRVGLGLAVALSIVLLVAGNVFAAISAPDLGADAGGFLVFLTAIGALALTSIAVGVVISLRVPGNRIGPLLIIGALGIQTVFVGWPMSLAVTDVDLLGIVAWWANVILVPSLFLLFPGVGIIFPDGHLPGPGWRLPVAMTVAVLAAGSILVTIAPWPLTADQPVPNPLALPGVPDGLSALGGGLSALALFAGLGLAVAGVIVRFRRADAVERAQIKWLVAALSLMAVTFPVSFATDVGPDDLIDLISVLVGCLTPLAIGIAILRYRLYDIDRLVSRTVSWALVSGSLLAVFAGLVIGLQTALDGVTQGGTVAVALSTLVVAALFQPIRHRVQRMVDRRFDRTRYDAERTAEAFAQRLSAEVDLETLAAELRATASATVRPSTATIWLAERHAPRPHA